MLTLIGPRDVENELRDTVRAWILFGGYGSRTRRGVGSLTVIDDRQAWLPQEATLKGFTDLFGGNLFAHADDPAKNMPRLAGASLLVGSPVSDAHDAWRMAVRWLADFRQGTQGERGNRAREPGPEGRPSISNWPEADKIRHLTGKIPAHPLGYNKIPAWPRATFGLPIKMRFQTEGRDHTNLDEPGSFSLLWRDGQDEHRRLASPLIVKALPLANGAFVPSALWLDRATPQGEVFLEGVAESGAPFDRILDKDDVPRFSPLQKPDLRRSFLGWVTSNFDTTVVVG